MSLTLDGGGDDSSQTGATWQPAVGASGPLLGKPPLSMYQLVISRVNKDDVLLLPFLLILHLV